MRTSRPDSWKHPRNRPQNRGCMPQPVAHLLICVKESNNLSHRLFTQTNAIHISRRRMSQSQSVDNDAGFANLVEPIGNLRFRSLFRHNFHRAAFRIHIAHTQCRFGYLRRTFQIPLLTLRSECPLMLTLPSPMHNTLSMYDLQSLNVSSS